MNFPSDIPSDLRAQLETLAARNPRMAEAVLSAWQAKREREAKEASTTSPDTSTNDSDPKTDDKAPPKEEGYTDSPPSPTQPFTGPSRPSLVDTDWREVRRFEWADLLVKAEALLERWGHWSRLGPLAPMVRLLVAHAIRLGARQDPSREAHVFLAQWELAAMLGVSERTLERWLWDPRYARYRQVARMWIAWETWYTEGAGIGKGHAVRGGTVWRVRVRPILRARPIKVLAPYLRYAWRDLAEDQKKGRTAKVLSLADSMSGYKDLLKVGQGITLQGVVGAPLATLVQKTPLLLDPDTARDLRALLRAASIPGGRDGRRRWAQDAAAAIAKALGDGHSVRYWLRVVWAALKALVFGGGEGALRVILRVVLMVQEARRDGFARKPGAYAQALLKREGYWDLVAPFQGFRVGVMA